MDESDFGDVCRGVIGSGHRICLRVNCNVVSHATKKVSWTAIVGDDSQCIFIRGASGTDTDASVSVFGSPVLPGSFVRDAEWAELETGPRSLESWQATFAAIKETKRSANDEDMDHSAFADILESTKHDVKFVFTPARKKHRGKFSGLDEISEDGDVKPAVAKKPVVKPIPYFKVPSELGSQPGAAICTLTQGAWRDLVANVGSIKATLEIERAKLPPAENVSDIHLNEIEMKLSVLHELLGERPMEFGTVSAFGMIEKLMVSVHSLEEAVEQDRRRLFGSLGSSMSSDLKVRLEKLEEQARDFETSVGLVVSKEVNKHFSTGDFRTQFIEPTMKLLSRSSRTSADPGGKWDQELSSLSTRVSHLETTSTKNPGQSSVNFMHRTGPNNSTGLFQWNSNPSQPPNGMPPNPPTGSIVGDLKKELTSLREEVTRLKAEVKDLQDLAETDAIVVGSIVFASKKYCESWLLLHSAASDPHVFVDPVSLLSLATSDASQDEERAANQRATTAKVKDKSPYHTAYIASFSLELPPLLGKGGDTSLTTNSRALAGVPKFVDFHPPSGREGIHQRILDYIKDGKKTLEESIGDLFSFGSEPASVARELLLLSKTFWDELCHWMVRYHREIKEESDASEHEVWILISHCVRAVFKSLRDARAPGRASNTPGGMLWGTLRAHDIMREYRSHDFSGHPKIALILHEHLIRFSTPRSKFDELQHSIDDKLEKVQRSINQAVAAANKKGSAPKASAEAKKQQS